MKRISQWREQQMIELGNDRGPTFGRLGMRRETTALQNSKCERSMLEIQDGRTRPRPTKKCWQQDPVCAS